jgi:putative phosphonate metabolism protein
MTSVDDSGTNEKSAVLRQSVTQIAYGIRLAEVMPMRYAIYFTPERADPLARTAANWLGRDPFSDAVLPPPETGRLSPAEIAFHTAAARRYGFHATLKAPFRLAEKETEASLKKAMEVFAESVAPVTIPRLVITQIDGFFALVPERPLPELNRFADDVVVAFARFRAPLTEAEIELRNPDTLSPVQFRNLYQWGYPYVFEAFRFHMTLTGKVAAAEAPRVRAAIEEFFGAVLEEPAPVDGLAIFVEPEPGAPFTVLSYHPLRQKRERKIA